MTSSVWSSIHRKGTPLTPEVGRRVHSAVLQAVMFSWKSCQNGHVRHVKHGMADSRSLGCSLLSRQMYLARTILSKPLTSVIWLVINRARMVLDIVDK